MSFFQKILKLNHQLLFKIEKVSCRILYLQRPIQLEFFEMMQRGFYRWANLKLVF